MSYLFLSFADHMDKTTNIKSEFYNLSLNEQFKLLQKRIPLDRQSRSLQSFIEVCFPTEMTKRYYISCPNFLREKVQKESGAPSYLRNVVVRPELTLSMRRHLPDNQNIILVGDIYESNKAKVLQIKGIQFIDASMSSPNDLPILAKACSSFSKSQGVNRMGSTVSFYVWTVDSVDMADTLFTPDFVLDLIQSCYTVKNPEMVRKTFEEWKKYIDFRKYYLDEQSKRNFLLDSAEFVEAYAINRKEYRKNSSVYDDYILDGIQDFTRGEMVVLSSKVEDAEPFPLVRLNIDRNKKAFLEARVNRRGVMVNEEERRIRSLASDNVFITAKDPESNSAYKDKNGNPQPIQFGEMLSSGYALGDRFRIVKFDIQPEEHLEQLEEQYELDIDRAYKDIDAKYEKIIKDELKEAVDEYKNEIDAEVNKQLTERKKQLDSYLGEEAKQNVDPGILTKIAKLKAGIRARLTKETKKDKTEEEKVFKDRLNALIEKAYSEIDIKALYIERNIKLLSDYKVSLASVAQRKASQYEIQKSAELGNKYKEDIRSEKESTKVRLDAQLTVDKEKVIEEETIIRFSLYFRLGDANNVINDKQIKAIKECKYIVYDSRAEKAKIFRQETALNNFYSGYVKNPYLSTYLFNPESLPSVQAEFSDWTWYLESLNEKQKEAVRKAVSSNGIFLLQGPPGTGKTQVIAETVAQMVKKGKKVLISSETHKAIDNVFERLPKIAEIVPIRLIPSNNNKKGDNEYDPKFLVDNFYGNISSNMKKAVDRYRNFRKNKNEFSETYDKLKLLKSKIEKSQKVFDDANKEIAELESKAKGLNSQISILSDSRDDIRIQLDVLRRTKRHIENDDLRPDEDVSTQLIIRLRDDLAPLFDKNTFVDIELGSLVKNINQIKMDEVDRELAIVNPKSSKTILDIRRRELRAELDKYVDDLGEIIKPEDEEKVLAIKDELRKVINKLKKEASGDETPSLKLCSIFNYAYLVDNLDSIKRILEITKEHVIERKVQYIEGVNGSLNSIEADFNNTEEKIEFLKGQIKRINDSIIEIQEREDVQDIQENRNKLESEINKFFKDFEIAEPYKDIDEALKIIKRRWYELENDFLRKEQENKEKIPMYEKISNYLSMEDVIEADRKEYTKDLFDNANVFGITCTSNDRFSGRNVDALSEYNIDEFDIKSVGIDVVIIDEVSKSSFIDLLIPILYGKTVVLVGDHRQLPPMYEFSKLRDDDFEGLDENIINKDINKKFTALYEECFFKTLFERIPESYKTMLVQQYRCHEHIMNVFNHFYQGELKLGFAGQNNTKKHNIKLISNGRSILEPDKHIYFVDCKANETHEQDSTSMYNTGEAKVVVELIRKLNDFFKRNPDREKLSIGVICTYGDQARRIKEILRSERVKTDAFKTDVEKMIVSTVDDFQGDERDIIILSTVRNPENPAKSNPGFILAYQRINVALSRARRLLIMVGNRKYLESKGVIDLPDVNGRGNDRRNFRVYEEILYTIEKYGKVIDDVDVLEDKETRING